MRNRAKCKLCNEIIESFHVHDYVSCKCEEIAVDGGQTYFRCAAKDWNNFLRIDDDDKEFSPLVEVPKSKDKANAIAKENMAEDLSTARPMTKKDMINELGRMIANIEQLPPQAMQTAITHYDFSSLLMLLVAIFESDLNDCS